MYTVVELDKYDIPTRSDRLDLPANKLVESLGILVQKAQSLQLLTILQPKRLDLLAQKFLIHLT